MKTVKIVLTVAYDENSYDDPVNWHWNDLIDGFDGNSEILDVDYFEDTEQCQS